ncbi:MAG: ORF6N domain-containing protein [Candidatus Margulisbacteria bacterium]|nr:ORF6N domain-containing protein [Candidatus Margulisiibacteriota bacterium]
MDKLIPIERVESKIYMIRGQKVMIDRDLAELYGVETFYLNKAVKRNITRFPADFMFQITKEEDKNLTFQFGISSLKSQSAISRWGGRRKLPYVFTEQGVAMLSSVLHSEQAIQVNILIMRAFVKIKQALATHVEVSRKLRELEGRLDKNDRQITNILEAIRKMVEPDPEPERRIGFLRERD